MNSNNQKPSQQGEKPPSDVLGTEKPQPVEDDSKDEKVSVCDVLLALAESCEFWHDHTKTSYVSIPAGEHREHYNVWSRSFQMWLRQQFYGETGSGVGREPMNQAIETLAAMALFDGEQYPVHLRVGRDPDGTVWLDLCDDEWRAVKITPEGWEVIDNPPVRFVRQRGMLPLPIPSEGDIDKLWPLVHCADADKILIAGFSMNCLHAEGPYFGLNILGPKGSAKSTATNFIRTLLDPNEAFSQTMPDSAENLALTAQGQRILAFENISVLSDVESDRLCRLSTGDAFRRRTLYVDADESLFKAKRPWIINGIGDVVSRGDLIDRALAVELPPIRRENRREEAEIEREFKEAHPAILGALLDAASAALKYSGEVREAFGGQLPRMADVAVWITAAEETLGFERGSFIKRHREMSELSSASAAESTPTGATVIKLAEEGGWEGLMKDLLDKIGWDHPNDRAVPKSARGLGNSLRRLEPDLHDAYGIHIESLPRTSKGINVRISNIEP